MVNLKYVDRFELLSLVENDFTVDKRKLNVSDLWFAWCQTCRHGGHVKHMLEWFEEHTECPVNNCDCNCMSLDRVK